MNTQCLPTQQHCPDTAPRLWLFTPIQAPFTPERRVGGGSSYLKPWHLRCFPIAKQGPSAGGSGYWQEEKQGQSARIQGYQGVGIQSRIFCAAAVGPDGTARVSRLKLASPKYRSEHNWDMPVQTRPLAFLKRVKLAQGSRCLETWEAWKAGESREVPTPWVSCGFAGEETGKLRRLWAGVGSWAQSGDVREEVRTRSGRPRTWGMPTL